MKRLICIEEHFNDGIVSTAARDQFMASASFMDAITDAIPPEEGEERPWMVPPSIAAIDARDVDAKRIARMDEHRVDTAVLSLSNTSAPQFIPKDKAVDLVRKSNDQLAETVRRHPGRYLGFAALPWTVPDAAAEELRRCVQDLGFVGAMIAGNVVDSFLDAPQYDPILAAFNEREVPLYVHPNAPFPAVRKHYYEGFSPDVSARFATFGWGWHHEAGIHALRLILSGAFDRHPGFQIISGHWGEIAPYFLQRLDDTISQELSGLERSVLQTYREHVYVTPGGMMGEAYASHFRFIYDLLGPERIMWATDYPFATMNGAREALESLDIPEAERELIAHGNAERLFRL